MGLVQGPSQGDQVDRAGEPGTDALRACYAAWKWQEHLVPDCSLVGDPHRPMPVRLPDCGHGRQGQGRILQNEEHAPLQCEAVGRLQARATMPSASSKESRGAAVVRPSRANRRRSPGARRRSSSRRFPAARPREPSSLVVVSLAATFVVSRTSRPMAIPSCVRT